MQFGLAMICLLPAFNASNASSGLISGTTSGTSSSMRKAEELSMSTVPYLVICSANRLDVPAPAEAKAMSMPSNDTSGVSSSTL